MKKSDPVVYIGGATKRRITKSQWEGADIKDQDTVEWGPLNGKRITVGDLSPTALEFLLMNHPGEFVVGEVTGEKMLDAIAAQRAVDEAASAAPNGN